MTQMYDWVVTWNPIGGECPHNCDYCYRKSMMRRPTTRSKYIGKPRIYDVKKPVTDKVIFVCSMTDLFADEMPVFNIGWVLERCRNFQLNTYLFQTKNPKMFREFHRSFYPENSIFGTTIESNRDYTGTKAPCVHERAKELAKIEGRKMVSIEPIMDFDLEELVSLIKKVKPEFVSIGADSKKSNLKEPSREKVEDLIIELKRFTNVRIKPNLNRLKKSISEMKK